MRANRLNLAKATVELGTATNASDIAASMTGPDRPDIMVIDSIQTMFLPSHESAPGTLSQVRASAQELIRSAKNKRVALLIVGHVTKDGIQQLAGLLLRMVRTFAVGVLFWSGFVLGSFDELWFNPYFHHQFIEIDSFGVQPD